MRAFFGVWLIALAVKTGLALWLPFFNDEAYYWVWGHLPQLSYYDHPPMVGWLFSIGVWMESFAGALGHVSRLPAVWLGHCTLLVWQQILAPFIDEKKQRLWLIFVLFSPFLGLGSLIVTPDLPFLFFWSLSLLVLLKLVEKPTLPRYFALGVSLGLGFCSKYLIVLFVPIAFLWLFFSGKWRQVRWSYVPVTIVAGLLFCTPVIYWNWQNEWVSFIFQLNHGLVSEKFKWNWPLDYLGGQLLLLLPLLVWLATRRREPKGTSFLHFFGWLPLAFFFYTSFKARVEGNWPIMAHPAVLSLAFLNMREWKWMKLSIAIWAVAMAIVLSEVASPWIPIGPNKLKTSEFTRFDAFVAEATSGKEIYFGSYQMASAVSFKARRVFYKLGGINRRDFYDFLPQSYPNSDRFWVGMEVHTPLPDWVEKKGYHVTETQQVTNDFLILEVSKRAPDSDR